MPIIREDLPQTSETVSGKNVLNSYFPVRTKDIAGTFDWDAVVGFVIRIIYRKEISFTDIEEFRSTCKSTFLNRLDNPDFWPHLEKMYFDNNRLFGIAPEFLLFKATSVKGNKPNARLSEMYASLLQDVHIKDAPKAKLNYLEQNIVDILRNNMKEIGGAKTAVKAVGESEYLPFLSCEMQNDMKFLSRHPNYFLETFSQFLRLYAYLYTSQMALNIGSWKEGEPSPKPVYFILDSETASAERSHLQNNGHQRVHVALYKIFPYLAMSECLQVSGETKEPIWALAQKLDSTNYEKLKGYAEAFKEERTLNYSIRDSGEVNDILEDLLELGMLQFDKGQSRHEINNKYVKTIDSELCNHFIQSRGRAGRVLVINQDYLLLLTNISIGEREQRSFHELLAEFRKRGVFFDKKSQQVLIQFYERIGNVERKSDSGDAVYVRKTI